MKLWRLVRQPFLSLDGAGAAETGTRWTSPGRPVVNFASDASLAVLIVLRYLPRDLAGIDEDYLLGWTVSDEEPIRIPFTADPLEKRALGDAWLSEGKALFARVQSAVMPEADLILMNPRASGAKDLAPLTTRPFSFAECLACPPLPE